MKAVTNLWAYLPFEALQGSYKRASGISVHMPKCSHCTFLAAESRTHAQLSVHPHPLPYGVRLLTG